MPDTTMSKEQWLAKGKLLFGEDFFNWRFVCPGCGNIQAVKDFKPYKEQGSTPDSARQECLGRYTGGKSWASDNPMKTGGPCDYAGYGLFDIRPIEVIDGDTKIRAFAFDESGVV